MESLEQDLENEWYLVRHSGEIPEIALNASLYYLTRSAEGPHHTLQQEHITLLQDAACARYREIVLRDLEHDNVTDPGYRGVARSLANYQRYCTFATRQGLSPTSLREETASMLSRFLKKEAAIVLRGERRTIINCDREELNCFCDCLGVSAMEEIDSIYR